MKEKSGLFGKVVNLEDSTVFIHGMFHDSPFISVQEEIKYNINKQLEGCKILCEDGFSYWIPNAKSFNEIEHFKIGRSSLKNYLLFIKSYIKNKVIFKKQKYELAEKLSKINTIEDLCNARDEFLSKYPSEPEGMNSILNRYGNGKIDEIRGNPPLRIRRYLYEAQQTLDYIKKNRPKSLHIIVGLAHELPLEYLLKNSRILHQYSA